jgi:hypothetical protein
MQARESAASRLFDLPLYRELATRAIYEALASLPAEQQKQARAALRDPKTLALLKQAILRSAAATFTVREIDWLHRSLAADEARSVVDKLDLFRVALLKETLAAALTNPELAPLLIPQ